MTSARSAHLRVRVTPGILEALRAVASRDGITPSELIRRLIADHLRRAGHPGY